MGVAIRKVSVSGRLHDQPAQLLSSREGRLTLMDVLVSGDYEVCNLKVPEGTSRHNILGSPGKAMTRELPVSDEKPSSIIILEKGPPQPGLDHRKFEPLLTRTEFLSS